MQSIKELVKNANSSMQEVVLLAFAHVLINTAVVTGSLVGVLFHAHFMLDRHWGIDDWEIILNDKGHNEQETRRAELFWQ